METIVLVVDSIAPKHLESPKHLNDWCVCVCVWVCVWVCGRVQGGGVRGGGGEAGREEAPPLVDRGSDTVLCALDDLADPGSKGFRVGRRERMFVVRKDGQVYGYMNLCPHQGTTLDWKIDAFLTQICRKDIEAFRQKHEFDALSRGAVVFDKQYPHPDSSFFSKPSEPDRFMHRALTSTKCDWAELIAGQK